MKLPVLITRVFALLVGVGLTLLVLEGVLLLLPVQNGLFAAEPNPSWPVHTLIPNSNYTHSTGWNLQNIHRGHVNNYGYVSPLDYQEGSGGIAVIGDSYIESMMNDYRDTLPARLNEYLKHPQTVMNFGMSGAEMPDYLGIAPMIQRHFSPQWVIVLITLGDFTNGFSADAGHFKWQPAGSPPLQLVPVPHRSALTRQIRTVALVRYLRGNLSMRPADLIHLQPGKAGALTRDKCLEEVLSKQDEVLLETFARELPAALGLPPARVILVFDSDRQAIYSGKSRESAQRCRGRQGKANDRLMELAATAGMQVIDTFSLFQRHFAAGRGPVDRAPMDPHWNPEAHRIVAQEVARTIDP